jgi:DNA-binding HxlR family transcriptional regulator
VLELSNDMEKQVEDAREDAIASDCSVAGILRLIGSGAGAQILMALGAGPLRTNQLTDRIEDFSSRSVYRHASEMEACGLIDREQEPGVPSKVVLKLSEPAGRELFRLFRAFATTSMTRSPAEDDPFFSWSSLNLLGELWKLGFLEELSYEPRSLAQFARGAHELTFHQVNRRVGLFLASGLLAASPPAGNGKRYELTRYGRLCMALVAGIGRWRRHVLAPGIPGLTIVEMAAVLRAVMPLTVLPEHIGESIDLSVTGTVDASGNRDMRTLRGAVGTDGTSRYTADAADLAVGEAGATINIWFAAILDGNRGRMRVRRKLDLVDSFLTQLYDVLWDTSTRATPASNVAGDG